MCRSGDLEEASSVFVYSLWVGSCLLVRRITIAFVSFFCWTYTWMSTGNGLRREVIPRVSRGVGVRSTLELLDQVSASKKIGNALYSHLPIAICGVASSDMISCSHCMDPFHIPNYL